MKELRGNISNLSKTFDNLDSAIVTQEQCYCQNWLLLHSLEEESNENTDQHVTDVLRESMGDAISIQDIDQSHRLPGKEPNKK